MDHSDNLEIRPLTGCIDTFKVEILDTDIPDRRSTVDIILPTFIHTAELFMDRLILHIHG